MKKWILAALAALLLCCPVLSLAQETISVYNWGDYIEPEVLDLFEEETGIKVIYETFETNEDMLKRIYGMKDGMKMWRKEMVRVEFDELCCGGLKEYAEYDYSTGSCELRKSAMKGMTDENQISILPSVDMGLGSCVKWTQKQKIWNGEAYELRDVEKQSVVRSIYMEEGCKVKRKVKFKEKDV